MLHPQQSPGAPCSLPRSSTGLSGCREAALEPSRRNFPSERRSHITGNRTWSSVHLKCLATSRIACVPSSLICTRSLPLSRSSMFRLLRSSCHWMCKTAVLFMHSSKQLALLGGGAHCRKHDLANDKLDARARYPLNKKDPRKRAEHLRNLPRKNVETAAQGAADSDKGLLVAIATACARTVVRLLFRRSGACIWRR
jgi:hypothetical protein